MMPYTEEELRQCSRFRLLQIASASGLDPEICKKDYDDIIHDLLSAETSHVTKKQIEKSPLMRVLRGVYEAAVGGTV